MLRVNYDPAIVANALLQGARQRGLVVDHMKLQKLLFFVHAWSLALNGTSPVAEKPEAWQYGPVFDSLYHKLKPNGRSPISTFIPTWNAVEGRHVPMVPNEQDTMTWDIVRQVLDRYGNFSALQLSTLSHESGGPWDISRAKKTTYIDDSLIANFYRQKLQPNHVG